MTDAVWPYRGWELREASPTWWRASQNGIEVVAPTEPALCALLDKVAELEHQHAEEALRTSRKRRKSVDFSTQKTAVDPG